MRILKKIHNGSPKNRTFRSFFNAAVVVTALFLFVVVTAAQAQQTPYYDLNTPEVTVDLSVLNDGGLGRPGVGAVSPSVGGGQLIMPGGRQPVSRLLVTPPKKRTVRKPKRAKAKRKVIKKRKPKARVSKPRKKKSKPKTKVAAKPAPKKPSAPSVPSAPSAAKKPPAPPAPAAPPKPPALAKSTDSKSAPPPPPPVPAVPQPAEKAAKKAAKPAPTQKAALPKASAAAGSADKVRVVFPEASAKVPNKMKATLKKLASRLKGKSDLRLQLMSYAGGKNVSPSKARRLSLSRALSVRSFLISNGVRSTRIDVRALGSKTTETPINRVDVSIAKR